MSPTTIALPLAFLALAGCVLWVLAKSRGGVLMKSLLVVTTVGLGIVMWSALSDLEGWPAVRPPETSYELRAAIIVPPDRSSGDAGRIYLWMVPRFKGDADRSASWLTRFRAAPDGEPRAYRVPYSKRMGKKIEAAQRRLRNGERVLINMKKVKGRRQEGKKAENGKKRPWKRGESNSLYEKYDAEFWYDVPSSKWEKPTR